MTRGRCFGRASPGLETTTIAEEVGVQPGHPRAPAEPGCQLSVMGDGLEIVSTDGRNRLVKASGRLLRRSLRDDS